MHSAATFQIDEVDDIVIIFDLSTVGVSVSADIKMVLLDVRDALGGLVGRPVIFRNRQKRFVGVQHWDGRFRDFYDIGESVLERAIRRVQRSTDEPAQPQWAPPTLAPVIPLRPRLRLVSSR